MVGITAISKSRVVVTEYFVFIVISLIEMIGSFNNSFHLNYYLINKFHINSQ